MFSGCLGLSSDISLEEYTGDNFTISRPAGWEVIDGKQLTTRAPKETIVVFRAKEAQNGVFSNIAVVREAVAEGMDSLLFAKANVEKIPLAIRNFQTLSQEEIEIDGQKTILFNFLGQETPEKRNHEYLQIYFVKNGIGYAITAIFAADLDATTKDSLKEALKTFRFK